MIQSHPTQNRWIFTIEGKDFDEIDISCSLREIREGLSYHFADFEFVYKRQGVNFAIFYYVPENRNYYWILISESINRTKFALLLF